MISANFKRPSISETLQTFVYLEDTEFKGISLVCIAIFYHAYILVYIHVKFHVCSWWYAPVRVCVCVCV